RDDIGRMEKRVQALDDRVARAADSADEGRDTLRAVERAVAGFEERLGTAIDRVGRAEESLFQGVLESEKRLSANVRQVIEEVVAERVPEMVTGGQRELAERLSGTGDDVRALRHELSQLHEESRSRHELVMRMLESMSGRLILDMEAQNKNAWFLDRLRTNSRWQLAASLLSLLVLVAALGAAGAYKFGVLGHF
ncbi:MAG TPA: hypothetical protein V6D47_02230, partial [Oscillatoriaceae cyanobacterium]